MVRRIRKFLRLQRQAGGLPIDDAAMAGESAGQFVAGVNLDTWLISVDFQHPSACGIADPDGGAI